MVKTQKPDEKERKHRLGIENNTEEFIRDIAKKRNGIKAYVKDFKADVKRKKKSFKLYAQKILKAKKSHQQ